MHSILSYLIVRFRPLYRRHRRATPSPGDVRGIMAGRTSRISVRLVVNLVRFVWLTMASVLSMDLKQFRSLNLGFKTALGILEHEYYFIVEMVYGRNNVRGEYLVYHNQNMNFIFE